MNFEIDEISQFLIHVQTDSSVSMFPNVTGNSDELPLTWYNHESQTFHRLNGFIRKTIQIDSNSFTWDFFTSDINYIILGRDFISHFLSENLKF